MEIILGSSSPRRKEILKNFINNFTIIVPDINEDIQSGITPIDYCKDISQKKAESIYKNNHSLYNKNKSFLIICCDTIVEINNKIIGKPADIDDAVKIIKILNGKEHRVISSITLFLKENEKEVVKTECDISNVKFKLITEKEIYEYLNLINYIDKAGAYAAQEHGDLIIDSISGSKTNVIGFPLRLFFKMLQSMDLLKKLTLN
jgi:septum formation protein